MNIGIIDADLIGRKKHRFPNLACEKISAYYKGQGDNVTLLQNYDNIDSYDKIFVSKVFTDTPSPDWLIKKENIYIGGTGFFFDKAPSLPYEIEHYFPDYHLYDDWIKKQLDAGYAKSQFKEYQNYAIGFFTKGCFRKCPFCVNKKYNKVAFNAPLNEFYNGSQKKICLLDDNFLGYSNWKECLQQLIDTKKPFKFKQGLDERILTDEKCEMLFNANYDGDYTFAFDDIDDYNLIESKLKMIRKHTNSNYIKFYVLVGFKSIDINDIINAFKRIELLVKYHCTPYIMRYKSPNDSPWERSEFRQIYITMSRWCNQPSIFKRKSYRELCELDQSNVKTKTCASMKALIDFENKYPEYAKRFFDMKFKPL